MHQFELPIAGVPAVGRGLGRSGETPEECRADPSGPRDLLPTGLKRAEREEVIRLPRKKPAAGQGTGPQ